MNAPDWFDLSNGSHQPTEHEYFNLSFDINPFSETISWEFDEQKMVFSDGDLLSGAQLQVEQLNDDQWVGIWKSQYSSDIYGRLLTEKFESDNTHPETIPIFQIPDGQGFKPFDTNSLRERDCLCHIY